MTDISYSHQIDLTHTTEQNKAFFQNHTFKKDQTNVPGGK